MFSLELQQVGIFIINTSGIIILGLMDSTCSTEIYIQFKFIQKRKKSKILTLAKLERAEFSILFRENNDWSTNINIVDLFFCWQTLQLIDSLSGLVCSNNLYCNQHCDLTHYLYH